jgi:alpha-D-xyloside xylohydrolase
MRRLIALAALAAALSACGGGTEERGVTVKVEHDPFRVTLVRDGDTVVRQDRDARLRYQLASSGDQHKLTRVTSSHGDTYEVATDEPGRTATVTLRPTDQGYRLSLRLHPETDVQQVYDAFETGADEHFLGSGERGDFVDLRGQILQIKVAEPCTYAPVPFFASSAGWGVRLATMRVSALAFPGSAGGSGCQLGQEPACGFPPLEVRAEVCVQGARLDEDLYAGSFPEVLRDYWTDAGPPRVPPPSELELIKWRDVVESRDEVLDDVRRLRAARIPIGWVLLDNPWETCNGTLDWDTKRIRDPAGLVREVHALGVRFMLWISPKVTCGNGWPPGAELGKPESRTLDLRKPAVLAEYRRRLRRLAAIGVDGVKGDRGDEVDVEAIDPTLQNRYPLLFAKAVLGVFPPDAGAIFRAGTMGSQTVLPGLWAGDQGGDWTGLQRAIRSAQTATMSGFFTWGSDVGGYSSEHLTEDVFVRWAQLGAISPVLEVGGVGANARPWTLGAAAMPALRDAAVLHYELFPYLYGLLQRRDPVLRPLGYAYPDDPEAWEADLELLVGPDLLAAPVAGPGTSPSVYLPAGRWVDLYAGVPVEGGRTLTRETPLAEFPLYVRDGAVIPFNLRTSDSWWGVDELTHAGRAGFLATNGAELDLHGQPADVQLFVPAAARPAGVTLDGRDVEWSWHGAPLPGAVVRVHGPDVAGRIELRGA